MGIILIRHDNGSEQLCLEAQSEAENVWSSEVGDGMLSRHLNSLGVNILPADFDEVVDGLGVAIHPLAMSGRAQSILASTYFMGSEQDGLPCSCGMTMGATAGSS